MRESIQVKDAHLFADHFYPTLFAQLNGILSVRNRKSPPPSIPFSEMLWVRATQAARRNLTQNRAPEDFTEWTFPVVYVSEDELHVHPREIKVLSADERLELISQLDVLRSVRETLKFATDADAAQERKNINEEIHQIENQLAGLDDGS
jgi:hypothetical protein